MSRTGPWTGTGPAGRGGGAGQAGGRRPPSAPVAGSAELRPTRRLPVLRPPLPVCVACFAPAGVAGTFRHRPGQRPPGSGPRDWPPRADEVTLVFPEARLRAAVSRGPGGSGVRGASGSQASRWPARTAACPLSLSVCLPAPQPTGGHSGRGRPCTRPQERCPRPAAGSLTADVRRPAPRSSRSPPRGCPVTALCDESPS